MDAQAANQGRTILTTLFSLMGALKQVGEMGAAEEVEGCV